MTQFARYTEATLEALKRNTKPQDAIARKQEILREVGGYHNMMPNSVLYVGFTPSIIGCSVKNIYATQLTEACREWLDSQKIKYTYIDPSELGNHVKAFDSVIALEEYFTFATSDADQQEQIKFLCSLAKEFVISTLKDYKNLDFKDREFSIPALVRNGNDYTSYIEIHDWDIKDRAHWTTQVHEIEKNGSLRTWGPFSRRTMYFKQLAKFSHDAGAAGFTVHKNLMYKSLIKKNYEHVISIRFDEDDGY
jgi:hypothetical protein